MPLVDACMENGLRALCLSLSLRFSTPSGTSKDGPRSDVSAERPPRQCARASKSRSRQQARLGVISGRFGGANQSVLSSFALAYGVLEKVTREAEKRSAHRYHDLVIGHKHHRAQDP